MSGQLEKARGDLARIEELLKRAASAVRRAFRKFVEDVRSPAAVRAIRVALEERGIDAALAVIDAHVVRFANVLPRAFQDAALRETVTLAAKVRRVDPRLVVSFDPSHPRAAELMRQNRLDFVREVTRAQRDALRSALAEALQTGAGPVQTARAIRGSIGLTQTQLAAVNNYRALLEAGDAAALARGLRDRRFDAAVGRATEGEPLGKERIDRMVEGYRARYLQYRAETIARTESLRVVNLARAEALQQVLEDTGLPTESVRRTWRATQDKRTRDTHSAMDGQVKGLNEPFESPSGALLEFPGDPTAPPSESVNCRCVVLVDITQP